MIFLRDMKLLKITLLIGVLVTTMMLMSGCRRSKYAEWADRDAYGALSEGQAVALGSVYQFDITYDPVDYSHYLEEAHDETGSPVQVLTVEDALKVAFKNSRSFQRRKEELYSAALALATSSRGWDTLLPSGSVNAAAEAT